MLYLCLMITKYCAITATKNRHTCLERVVTCFIKQDYEGDSTLLIYNNSSVPLELSPSLVYPKNKSIWLINNHIDYTTKKPYTNLGSIYMDALLHIPQGVDVVSFMDDDDIFLPHYVSSGVKGWEKAKKEGKLAYKPKRSYYKDSRGITMAENVLEPSIFVDAVHLKKHGFNETNVDSHHKWLSPLVSEDKILVDGSGVPTFIYDWSGNIPVWKTSGDPNNPKNFENYANWSQDVGDGIISSISEKDYINYTRII